MGMSLANVKAGELFTKSEKRQEVINYIHQEERRLREEIDALHAEIFKRLPDGANFASFSFTVGECEVTCSKSKYDDWVACGCNARCRYRTPIGALLRLQRELQQSADYKHVADGIFDLLRSV